MVKKLKERYTFSVGDSREPAIDFTDELKSGETLTGTPTVTEATGNLTLSNKAVNVATYVDANTGATVAVGKAVQFDMTTSTAGTYEVSVKATGDDGTIINYIAVYEFV